MSQETIDAQTEEPKTTLWDFIEKYQKMIAVVGVFVALGLFWKNLTPDKPTPYISYLCFLITIPLLLEIRKGYEYKTSTFNLRAFMDIFMAIFIFTTASLIFDYPEHFGTIISAISTSLLYFYINKVIDYGIKHFRDKRYRKIVQEVADMDSQEVVPPNRNEIVISKNKVLASYSSFLDALSLILLILNIILNFVLYSFFSEFIHAVITEEKPIPVIPIVN